VKSLDYCFRQGTGESIPRFAYGQCCSCTTLRFHPNVTLEGWQTTYASNSAVACENCGKSAAGIRSICRKSQVSAAPTFHNWRMGDARRVYGCSRTLPAHSTSRSQIYCKESKWFRTRYRFRAVILPPQPVGCLEHFRLCSNDANENAVSSLFRISLSALAIMRASTSIPGDIGVFQEFLERAQS
jgi:hypothetical protein